MSGLFDSAKNALNNDKVQDALKSDKAEEISDGALDRASDAAAGIGGGAAGEHVKSARDAADERIGNE